MEAIKHKDTSVHCDECGYERPVKMEDVPKLVGEKCPDCGEVMIEQSDVNMHNAMLELVGGVNAMIGDVDASEGMMVSISTRGETR